MQLPSLHLLPCMWLTVCKLAATQQAEGKGGFLLDTHLPSHVLTFINPIVVIPQVSSLQTHLSYKVSIFVLLEELLVLQNHRPMGSILCGVVAVVAVFGRKKIMAAGSVHGADLCHWSLAFREQLLCGHKNAKKERKEIKYLQEEK